MRFWEKIVGKKKTSEVIMPAETAETLDRKIADLENEKRQLLKRLAEVRTSSEKDLLRSAGARIGEKNSPRLEQIERQLSNLRDQRNALWEKQRRQREQS